MPSILLSRPSHPRTASRMPEAEFLVVAAPSTLGSTADTIKTSFVTPPLNGIWIAALVLVLTCLQWEFQWLTISLTWVSSYTTILAMASPYCHQYHWTILSYKWWAPPNLAPTLKLHLTFECESDSGHRCALYGCSGAWSDYLCLCFEAKKIVPEKKRLRCGSGNGNGDDSTQ